ncbi:MAG: hypothetical protein M3P53_08210 [Actinomycetota bacterium]|nr:hypothetical protein [Actinomycetota bacterium]
MVEYGLARERLLLRWCADERRVRLVRLRHLCERHQLRAELLFDGRKFLGAARMTTT